VIGPRGDQTSVHRYSIENFDSSSTFDDQAPSTTSKLSSSLLRSATSGKYQPVGGGG
jgi:hypothetical protein